MTKDRIVPREKEVGSVPVVGNKEAAWQQLAGSLTFP
jgi:hypothetical protein